MDFGRKVLTDGELGRQITRPKDRSAHMEEKTGDRIKRKKQNISLSS